MPDQETEKPSKTGRRWVDMDALTQAQSKRDAEELLRIWGARRKDSQKKKPKLPTGPSKG